MEHSAWLSRARAPTPAAFLEKHRRTCVPSSVALHASQAACANVVQLVAAAMPHRLPEAFLFKTLRQSTSPENPSTFIN